MKYLLALLLAFAVNAYAFDPKKEPVQILDVWECGAYTCAIAVHEDGRFLLAIGDTKGIKTAVHRGVILYERDVV